MPTNLLGVVAPGVEYAGVREQKRRHQRTPHSSLCFTHTLDNTAKQKCIEQLIPP